MTHPLADELRVAKVVEGADFGRILVCKIEQSKLIAAADLIDRLTIPTPLNTGEIIDRLQRYCDVIDHKSELVIAMSDVRRAMGDAITSLCHAESVKSEAVRAAYEETAASLEIRANEIEPGEMDAEEVKEWLLNCAYAIRARSRTGEG